ncbi:MAG: cobyrinate a,c-diamide synthase [Firmicutes bacterium]|nr:cobyrinate a,c-diamide synthase [Bacillota bacterium]
MQKTIPRVLLAGTNSSCGKTTVTCGILQALINRGLRVGACKCGPDYIDPMFHSRIIGAKSTNLDLFFFNENTARYLLAKNGADCHVSIIEGVMGFYDGLSAAGTEASSYHLAQVADAPVVLVVNSAGASLSVLATIHGFLHFFPDNPIQGVVLNQCSAGVYPRLAEAIRQRFGERVKPLGYLPRLKDCRLESRHLGLVTAAEVEGLKEKMQILAEQTEKTVDLDGLLALAGQAPPLDYQPVSPPPFDEAVRIAVARDRAFCFYYEDSLDLLRELGAELIPFSPLHDGGLPQDIHGLYLGGGYPELYAQTLSENVAMRQSIGDALRRGLPCIAECGGFMYLTEKVGDHPMVGYLPGSSYPTGKLTRFGYVTLQAQKDCLLCQAGEQIPAHEFHHWDSEDTGRDFTATKTNGNQWPCVFASPHLYAGFPHFHFYANPNFALRFYQNCLEEKHRHD